MPTPDLSDFSIAIHDSSFKDSLDGIEKVLENIDINIVDSSGWTLLMRACRSCKETPSPGKFMTIVFDKILEAGGPDVLKSQFMAQSDIGETCLMRLVGHCDSPTVVKLVFEKIFDVGGVDLFRSAITVRDSGEHDPNGVGKSCLAWASGSSIMKLVAALLYCMNLFEKEYERLNSYSAEDLGKQAGIASSSWSPDPETLAEAETILSGINFFTLKHAIDSNSRRRMRDILRNNEENAKKIFASKLDIIKLAYSEPETKLKTIKVLFSEIDRIGGDQYLQELLSKERTESFLYAACKFAPKYGTFALLVSKFFKVGCGRRLLRDQLGSSPCLTRILGRPRESVDEVRFRPAETDPADEMKFLFLIVALYSSTGLFEEIYSRLDAVSEEQCLYLRRVCKIESGQWSRNWSVVDSTMGDLIGDIKEEY